MDIEEVLGLVGLDLNPQQRDILRQVLEVPDEKLEAFPGHLGQFVMTDLCRFCALLNDVPQEADRRRLLDVLMSKLEALLADFAAVGGALCET